MAFSPELAAKRFGFGLSPTVPAPASPEAMMAMVMGTDEMAARHPVEPFDAYREIAVPYWELRRIVRRATSKTERVEGRAKFKELLNDARLMQLDAFRANYLRIAQTQDGFRERLVGFWGDHFATSLGSAILQYTTFAYREDAIRPHIAGRFSDLLKAAVIHPRMVLFLNQNSSVGPNSRMGLRNKKRGLNENLAREVLELHSLGVDGPYDQADVRALALVLTGLSATRTRGLFFDDRLAEPGMQTVLDGVYGARTRTLGDIQAVLDDIAVHPATARHLSWKLAVHFVADRPSAELVDHITARYIETGGHLAAVYAAMLEHPDAWNPDLSNVKWPFDFVSSSLRALAVDETYFDKTPLKRMAGVLARPTQLMGQVVPRPPGPDGWEEDDAHWITPQAVASRITWAMRVPSQLLKELPDPREFVHTALGDNPPEPVVFAARAAQSRAEGIGLILSSPGFQRR